MSGTESKPVTLGNALFSKTQQRVLQLLFVRSDRSFYTNEIVRYAGVGIGSVQRELVRLSRVGLLQVTTRGNQKHYQANMSSPIYEELRGIVTKTFGVSEYIKAILAAWDDRIVAALIYGVAAKSHKSIENDIDLLLVSDRLSREDIIKDILAAGKGIQREICLKVITTADLDQRLVSGDAFLRTVLQQPHVILKGEALFLQEQAS